MALSVYHQFYETFLAHPERNALFTNGVYYTYAQLFQTVCDIKALLQSKGYGNERLIGVLTGNDLNTYASLLAILGTGAGYVPINQKFPLERNYDIAEAAELKVILASRKDDNLLEIQKRLGDKAFEVLYTDDLPKAQLDHTLPKLTNYSIAYLLFTSGSTGFPKGVPIYHRNLNSFLGVMLDKSVYDLDANDRFLQCFELSFDLSVVGTFVPWCIGACCYLLPETGVNYLNIAAALEEHDITFVLMVPSVLNYLLQYTAEINLPKLRYSLFCGEALIHNNVKLWSKCVPNAIIENVYGPTEATIFCFRYVWNEAQSEREQVNGIVPIGMPMPDIVALVVDDNLEPLRKGNRGQLLLHGKQLTDGYYKNPDKTFKSFIAIEDIDPERAIYQTGDEVFVNENNNYIFCGRIDFQVKIQGYRVELGEIEHFVREFSKDCLCAVVAKQNEGGHWQLHLFLEKFDPNNVNDLKRFLAERTPPYMQPSSITVLDKMPFNSNGKIDRGALQDMVGLSQITA